MKIAVTSRKGGVGKSTVSMCLAVYFSKLAPTILVDGDVNKSVTKAVKRGKFPFDVAEPNNIAEKIDDYTYIIIDTKAQPNDQELETLAQFADIVVIPTLPNAFAIDGLLDTIEFFDSIKATNYVVLLTIVAPKPSTKGQKALEYLQSQNIPIFKTLIHRYEVYPQSQLHGIPLYETQNPYKMVAWSEIEQLGMEIIDYEK
jgi:chromosome partitioning protein